jgi:hypothetical protein
VAFAGAFYRALGFGKSLKEAFESAKAELGLTRTPRSQAIELFVRDGINENDSFPQTDANLGSKEDEPGRPFRSDLFDSNGREALVLEPKNLSRATRIEKANRGQTKDSARRRSAKASVRTCVAVTVQSRRVLLEDAGDVSQTQTENYLSYSDELWERTTWHRRTLRIRCR